MPRPIDEKFMRRALRLAANGRGRTSPNPMVGALLVKRGEVIGQGWHRAAGQPHAEVEALRDAARRGSNPRGATLYVTLEPCSTHGRTPPCTDAIIAAGIRRLVIGATDPNPKHCGHAYPILKRAGIPLTRGLLAAEAEALNEAFNHWVLQRTPFVTVKAAMTLDGRIATATGESKWITGLDSRADAMRLRDSSDAILVGVNTVLADDPSLTVRLGERQKAKGKRQKLRRIVLDSRARTPLSAKVVNDAQAALTTVVVGRSAPRTRVKALAKRVRVLEAPLRRGRIDLRWLMKRLGKEEITNLLVEGGGEVNGSFLFGGHTHRVAFYYAPKVLGGRDGRRAVGGLGANRLEELLSLEDVRWRRLGSDLALTARLTSPGKVKLAR